MKSKACAKCGKEKPAEEFNAHKKTKDRLNSWCRACYRQNSRSETAPVEYKQCSKCKNTKPPAEFYLRRSGRQSGRLMSQCITCCRADEKRRGYTRQRKSRVLERKYGITIEQFDLMFWAQQSKCPICNVKLTVGGKGKPTTACVDHDHDTGGVRGLLCSNCNRAVGLFRDNTDVMQRARQYVARSACRPLLTEVE